jgi:Dual specificity phosphatase, catalytic domain
MEPTSGTSYRPLSRDGEPPRSRRDHPGLVPEGLRAVGSGRCPRRSDLYDIKALGVDVVIDLEDWDWAWVPSVPLGKVFVSFPMEDENDVDPKVRDVAVFVASLVGWGRKVLVHCTEGLNRSGVVIARALMEMGRSAPEAIELVRRGGGPSVDGFPALGNEAFIAWLNDEDRGQADRVSGPWSPRTATNP